MTRIQPGNATAASPAERGLSARLHRFPLAVIGPIGCYLAAFYAVRLPGLGGIARWALVGSQLLLPDALVSNWLGTPPEVSIADRIPIVLTGAVILLVATAAGYLLLSQLRFDLRVTRLETLLFSVATGTLIVSTAVLAVGLSGHVRAPWLLAGAGAAVMLAASWRLRRRLRHPAEGRWREEADGWFDDPPRRTASKWLWLTLPWIVVALLGGLLPPIDFDVREYHLQVPKEFFIEGRIAFLPHNVYGNMPLGPQMLALLGMVALDDWWHGALVGKFLIASFLPLTSAMLYAAGCRWFSRSAGIAAAVLYVSIPWMVRVSNLGLVEGVYAFYLAAALYAFALWRGVPRTARVGATAGSAADAPRHASIGPTGLLLAGLLAGGAVTCKYPALLMVVAPLGLGVVLSGPARWRALALFAAAVLLGCGLWLGKNLVLTGNPIYPLLADQLDGATRTPEKIQQWRKAHRPPNFRLSDAARRVADVAIGSPWLSPLILPLALLALVADRGRGRILWLWGFVGYLLAAWWLFTHRIDRFWIPVFPVLALLAGVGATWSAARWWRRTLWTVLAAGLVANFLCVTAGPVAGRWGPGGYTRFFVGYDRLRVSPERVDPWHLWLNRHVPFGHAVLSVGDAQVFDLEMPVYYNTVFDDSVFERALGGRSPAAFHRWLEARDISHLWVHWGEIARYRSPGNYGFTPFVTPARFAALVRADVLAPVPPRNGHPGQVFVVLPLDDE